MFRYVTMKSTVWADCPGERDRRELLRSTSGPTRLGGLATTVSCTVPEKSLLVNVTVERDLPPGISVVEEGATVIEKSGTMVTLTTTLWDNEPVRPITDIE